MTNAMAAFGIAVGGTSLICYALITRLQNRKQKRGPSGDNDTNGGSSNFSGGDSWSLQAWFGGEHSAADSSGNPIDSGDDSGGSGNGGGSDGAAATDVAAADKAPKFDPAQHAFLDSFQYVAWISLESLENTVFPFASRRGLKYR